MAGLLLAGLIGLARDAGAADGPDLELDVGRLAVSARIATGVYHEPGRAPALDATIPISGTCVLHPDERCVGGPGIRKLLRFDVVVHNRGNEDLIVGNPKELPDLFVYSACHRHYHFKGAALYELLDTSGKLVKTGRKQGFCVEDTLPSDLNNAPPKRYDCKFQGIQVGWADWYPAALDCQWIDITDLPPGPYVLHVFWNPNRLMAETSLDNNEGSVPITIPAPQDAAPVVERIEAPSGAAPVSSGRAVDVRWAAHDDLRHRHAGGLVLDRRRRHLAADRRRRARRPRPLPLARAVAHVGHQGADQGRRARRVGAARRAGVGAVPDRSAAADAAADQEDRRLSQWVTT